MMVNQIINPIFGNLIKDHIKDYVGLRPLPNISNDAFSRDVMRLFE